MQALNPLERFLVQLMTTEEQVLENCIVPTSTGNEEVGWVVYESEGPRVLYVSMLCVREKCQLADPMLMLSPLGWMAWLP